MRFECKVRVVNRNPGGKSCNSYLDSTIALGKETYTENDYFLLHFSNTARGSLKGSRYTKYQLKTNPTKIFTKCVNEGKITISFEDPLHDLFIKGEVSQLSRFVELLNLCLAGEVDVLPTTITVEAKERYNKHLNEEKQGLVKKKKAKKSALKKKDLVRSEQEITVTNDGEETYNTDVNNENLGWIETEKECKTTLPDKNDTTNNKQDNISSVKDEIYNTYVTEDIHGDPEGKKLEDLTFLSGEKYIISKSFEITSIDETKDITSKMEENLCLIEANMANEEECEPKANTNYRRKKQKIKYRRLELWFSDTLRN